MIFGKSSHPFSEADQCSIVPVRAVPLSPENPTGYEWERPCKCPWWATVKQELVMGANSDGSAKTKEITIQGCAKRMLLWAIGAGVQQASAALHETVAMRAEVANPANPTLQLSALVGLAGLLVGGKAVEKITPTACLQLPGSSDKRQSNTPA